MPEPADAKLPAIIRADRDYQIAAPIQVLYDWRADNPAPATLGEAFDCVVLSVEITGRVAAAKVRETHDSEVAVDYFHLLNDNGNWSIVSKLWDSLASEQN